MLTPPAEHHLEHLSQPSTPTTGTPPRSATPRPTKTRTKTVAYGPTYLHWVTRPQDSFVVLAAIAALYLASSVLLPSSSDNPFSPFLFISYLLEGDREGRYRKGPKDLLFLPFWVVAFSFLRQASTLWVVKPVGRWLGIRGGRKMERFMEQGYAVIYFSCSSLAGLYVMSHQPTWWFNTSEFWKGYPHWDMPGPVKTYYLTQFAYWLQQALVMIAGLEKPRDDYVELVIHHIITLWLIGASYAVNLTQIGIAVFVSMDIPDLFLAISKCISYLGLERTGNCSFVVFMLSWGYLRHWQNVRILWSVWNESMVLTPVEARVWQPELGRFMPSWMRYQIFAPILALQLVIVFWSYLILRILFRMIAGTNASDVREEKETTETDADEVSEVEASGSGARKRGARSRTTSGNVSSGIGP
ncbi:hypothetical protein MNV49_007296 [Pseudohyphozyma bogoriensis]|nr:hypothetical protein MNV49_007296 [Pseudohyphozyma bogoriensis]